MPDVAGWFLRESIARGVVQLQQMFADGTKGNAAIMQPADDLSLVNGILGPDELLRIFDCLSPSDVLSRAALVCKRWAEIARSDEQWQPRVPAADAAALRAAHERVADLPLRRLFPLLLPANLLRNAMLQRSAQSSARYGSMAATDPWRTTMHRGQGWAWEDRGAGGMSNVANELLPLPLPAIGEQYDNQDSLTCPGAIASSFLWCELMQPIDLVAALASDRGFSEPEAAALLDASPPLQFSICYGARLDCRAVCEILVVLDDGSQPLPLYVGRQAFPWNRDALASWDSGALHPDNGAWHSVSACFHSYPAGVRRAMVVLRGKDLQFWAGQYGGKFAAPELKFITREELQNVQPQHGKPRKLGDVE